MVTRRILLSITLILLATGCIELKTWLFGPDDTGFDGTSFPPPVNVNDNTGDNQNDNVAPGEPPSVVLFVSNTQPLVRDQVDLRCRVAPGLDATGVTFAFAATSAALTVDASGGTAFFIVDEADVGAELRFSCTGTNEFGTGDESNEISVFPNSAPVIDPGAP